MTAFFVTATGTDIGKTFVTAGLVRHLRESSAAVAAVKPVMSGFEAENTTGSDAGALLAAMDEEVTEKNIARISPWRFAAPLSPDMAAVREGRTIDFDALSDWCKAAIASEKMLFIEGVGGVMVPLDACHTVLDWMVRLQVPLVLVTGSYLGTISHTFTAVDVCRRAGLSIAALIVNESEAGTVPIGETLSCLRRFLPEVPIAAVPRVPSPSKAKPAFAKLWRILED